MYIIIKLINFTIQIPLILEIVKPKMKNNPWHCSFQNEVKNVYFFKWTKHDTYCTKINASCTTSDED